MVKTFLLFNHTYQKNVVAQTKDFDYGAGRKEEKRKTIEAFHGWSERGQGVTEGDAKDREELKDHSRSGVRFFS